MACKYQNQYPIVYETCYRILLSLSGRYCNIRQSPVAIQRSEAAVALDLLLELFAEKNLANAPWEFGYAVGGSRILASASPAKPCTFCRQSFAGGAEMYDGLGDRHRFGLNDTSHYAGPVVTWALPRGPELRFSPKTSG